jgi:hypothetical protein
MYIVYNCPGLSFKINTSLTAEGLILIAEDRQKYGKEKYPGPVFPALRNRFLVSINVYKYGLRRYVRTQRHIKLKLSLRYLVQHGNENPIYVFLEKDLRGLQSQFPHSCVCERFIYSQNRSTYFPAAE